MSPILLRPKSVNLMWPRAVISKLLGQTKGEVSRFVLRRYIKYQHACRKLQILKFTNFPVFLKVPVICRYIFFSIFITEINIFMQRLSFFVFFLFFFYTLPFYWTFPRLPWPCSDHRRVLQSIIKTRFLSFKISVKRYFSAEWIKLETMLK